MDVHAPDMEASVRNLFDGSARGADYHVWFAVPDLAINKLCTTAHTAGRSTPDAYDLLNIVQGYIKHPSKAYDDMQELLDICSWRLQAALDNQYTSATPTTKELRFVLGLSMHLPGKSELVSRLIRDEFLQIQTEAQKKQGWIILGDYSSSASTMLQTPIKPENAGEAAAADASTERRILMHKGKKYDPNMYAYRYLTRLYAHKYGQATEDQEAEFNTFRQGSLTEEAYASELQRRAAALVHRADIDERSLMLRYINGLNDSHLANDLLAYLQTSSHKVTMAELLLRTNHCKSTLKELLAVQVQMEAAKAMQSKALGFDRTALLARTGDTGASNHSKPDASNPRKQLVQTARALAQSNQLPPDHDLAPCMLRGHSAHLNCECKSSQHPRNRSSSSTFAQPAAGAFMGLPTLPTPVAAAAAVPQGDAAKGLGAKTPWWRKEGAQDKIAQAGGLTKRVSWGGVGNAGSSSSGSGPRCDFCHMRSHSFSNCYYAHPDKAPPGFQPSTQVTAEAYLNYMNKHKNSDKQDAVAHKPAAAAVGGEQQPQELQHAAAALTLDEAPWYLGGALLAQDLPAAAAIKQPHGFWPRDNATLREPCAAGNRSSSKASARVSPEPDGVYVQVDFKMPLDRLPQLLALAGAPPAAELSSPNQAGKTTSDVNATAATTGELDRSSSVADTPVAGAGAPVISQQLPELKDDDLRMQLAAYNAECEQQTLYTFIGSSHETGVTMRIGDRDVLIPRPTQDGGCVPNLMSRRFADAAGISYTDGAKPVKNIEGQGAARMKWHTRPVQIVLARGTPGEAVLDVPEGFTVVDGDEAADMYDVILGRSTLAKVSGFVMPFDRQFYYMPKLQQLDKTMYSLPIMVGHSRQPGRQLQQDAAAAYAVPCSFQVAAACLQDTTYTGTAAKGAAMSAPEAHSRAPTLLSSATDSPEEPTAMPAVTHTVGGSSRRLMLLLLWPVLWLFGALDSFSNAVTQERPYQTCGKLYYRLGRYHRASDGDEIRLRYSADCSGHKPKVVSIHRRMVSWRFALTAVPARAILLLLMISFFCVTGTAAVKLADGMLSAASMSHAVVAGHMHALNPPPVPTMQVLMMGVMERLGHSFRCFIA